MKLIDRNGPLIGRMHAVWMELETLRLAALNAEKIRTDVLLARVGQTIREVDVNTVNLPVRMRAQTLTEAKARVVVIDGINLAAEKVARSFEDLQGAVRVLDRQLTDEEILAHLRRYVA